MIRAVAFRHQATLPETSVIRLSRSTAETAEDAETSAGTTKTRRHEDARKRWRDRPAKRATRTKKPARTQATEHARLRLRRPFRPRDRWLRQPSVAPLPRQLRALPGYTRPHALVRPAGRRLPGRRPAR